MNISETIIPKSDQLNADDLINKTMVITVTDAKAGPADQPVHIVYEGCGERVYKPNKTMRKILACCWGPETDKWLGQSMKLEHDPDVKWGGAPVGGIVISSLTDIAASRRLSLNASRGKKKEYVIEVLSVDTAKKIVEKKVDPLKEVKAELIAAAIRADIIQDGLKGVKLSQALEEAFWKHEYMTDQETLSDLDANRIREIIEKIDS